LDNVISIGKSCFLNLTSFDEKGISDNVKIWLFYTEIALTKVIPLGSAYCIRIEIKNSKPVTLGS
jgi:hypothetical protein